MSTTHSILSDVVEWVPLVEHEGRAGGSLTWAILPDGSRLMVKRFSWDDDLTMRATGDREGRAAALWAHGAFDALPPGVGHGILDAWTEGGEWVVVMEDLSAGLVPEHDRATPEQYQRLLEAMVAVHHAYRGRRVEGAAELEDYVALLGPQVMGREVGGANPLAAVVVRGWELFTDVAPPDVVAALEALHTRPGELAAELSRAGTTLMHGDVWFNNASILPDRVVFFDWALATNGVSAMDLGFLLIGNASRLPVSREQCLDDYRALMGEHHDERTLRVALLAALGLLGWNKALDIVEHPDPAKREMERQDLAWWVDRVRVCLESAWSPV